MLAALVALADREARRRWSGGRPRRRRPRRPSPCSCGSPVRPAGNSVAAGDRRSATISRRGEEQRRGPRPRDGEARHAHRVTPRRPSVTHRTDQPSSDDGRPGTLPAWPISRPSWRRSTPGARTHAAAAVIGPDGRAGGPRRRAAVFRWASVTKLVDRADRADRRGTGPARPRRAGRSARLDRPAPARPRLGARRSTAP